jgi:hypothetical protein
MTIEMIPGNNTFSGRLRVYDKHPDTLDGTISLGQRNGNKKAPKEPNALGG